MESPRKFFSVVVVVLLLVLSTEVARTHARECKTASNRFKGLCMLDTSCANMCITEGLSTGACEGLKRRCMCKMPC
ncbi:hypothetical protein ZWY2020_035513 [Hordeum vulgare]|nr:hypothetical protein ZWY2020_035513 [Hordeum vulgare]